MVLPICEKLEQLAPAHRSTKYRLIEPPFSVATVHVSVVWLGLVAAATTAACHVTGWLTVSAAE